jgi:hypothetical protein
VWTGEVLNLLALAEAAGDLRSRPGDDRPRALLSALMCGIGTLVGTSPRHALGIRMDVLWDLLLPGILPPGERRRYRTRPPEALRLAGAA